MIQTIFVEPQVSIAELKKEFRKKLMTGGAVLRIRPELAADDLNSIHENMRADAKPNNAAAQVLEQIALHPALSNKLRGELEKSEIPEVRKALSKRSTGLTSRTAS